MEKQVIRASLLFIVCLLAFGMYTALSVRLVDGLEFVEQFHPGMNKDRLAKEAGAISLECEGKDEVGFELCASKDEFVFLSRRATCRCI